MSNLADYEEKERHYVRLDIALKMHGIGIPEASQMNPCKLGEK